MIHLIVGRQGSGKTLLLTMLAHMSMLAGKTIYSNIHFNFPYKPLDYKQIVECSLSNAAVFIDEVHLLLPARRSMSSVSRRICDGFLSMARKQCTEIYGSTQTPRKVDVRFREEADMIWSCDKYAYIDREWQRVLHNQDMNVHIPLMIEVKVMDTFDFETVDASFLANPYFSMFDTHQIVKVEGLE